jgi:hypothetical protein
MPQLGAAVQGVIVVDFASPCDSSQSCGLRLTIPVFRSTILSRSADCPVTVRSSPRALRFSIR